MYRSEAVVLANEVIPNELSQHKESLVGSELAGYLRIRSANVQTRIPVTYAASAWIRSE